MLAARTIAALRGQHRPVKDCASPAGLAACDRPGRVRSEWKSTQPPYESALSPVRAPIPLSKHATGPKYHNTSRVETLYLVLTRLSNGRKDSLILEYAAAPCVRGTHSDGRHKRYDAGHRFTEFRENNLLPPMDNWSHDTPCFSVQLRECGLHMQRIRKVRILSKQEKSGLAPSSRVSTER